MTVTKIPMRPNKFNGISFDQWRDHMVDMLRQYLRGEPVYIEIINDTKRTGSIAKLKITNVQAMLGKRHTYWTAKGSSPDIEEIEANVKPEHFFSCSPEGIAKWDGRTNRFTVYGYYMVWLKGYIGETKFVYNKNPQLPKVEAKDKLGREINVGDFISYILYNFDNSNNSAGIYYGKVSKIEHDGTVWAKNIKLSDTDKSAEKRIKDNSLIVIMSKDLMDKLMLARLSII